MFNRSISVSFEGHDIELCNIFRPFRWQSYQILKIDGRTVAQSENSMLRARTDLSVCVELNGITRSVVAKFVARRWPALPLYVFLELHLDEKLVGNTYALDVRKMVESGFLKFAILRGIPALGLPFAIYTAIFEQLRNGYGGFSLYRFVFALLFFGFWMSFFCFVFMTHDWTFGNRDRKRA